MVIPAVAYIYFPRIEEPIFPGAYARPFTNEGL